MLLYISMMRPLLEHSVRFNHHISKTTRRSWKRHRKEQLQSYKCWSAFPRIQPSSSFVLRRTARAQLKTFTVLVLRLEKRKETRGRKYWSVAKIAGIGWTSNDQILELFGMGPLMLFSATQQKDGSEQEATRGLLHSWQEGHIYTTSWRNKQIGNESCFWLCYPPKWF